MRQLVATVVFSSLAMSGYAQAPGRLMSVFNHDQRGAANLRLVFPNGMEVRAERIALVNQPAETTGQVLESDLENIADGKSVAREYVLSGDVRLAFPAR